MNMNVSRRHFLRSSGTAAAGLMALQYGTATALAQSGEDETYRSFEDVLRQKWTWDKVVHSSHGTNCTGSCAFNSLRQKRRGLA